MRHHASQSSSSSRPLVTSKIPPGCDPERKHSFSFADWKRELQNWTLYCETPVQAQGPALIAQLGGLAREVAFEVPTWQLTVGDNLDFGDGRGVIHRAGLDILVHILTNRFDALELETQMNAMQQYQSFQRKSNEDIDTALARWELLKKRASERGQFQMSIPAESDHVQGFACISGWCHSISCPFRRHLSADSGSSPIYAHQHS